MIANGLDSQTAFAIVSIDIAEIAVGDNIGARLQINQAEADLRMARAGAEQRRTMAVAHLQEMVALMRENQAAVVLAEAAVPAAIADAFGEGVIGLRMKSMSPRSQSLRGGSGLTAGRPKSHRGPAVVIPQPMPLSRDS